VEDLNDKITGHTLTAAEWNQLPSEIQNVIEAYGQVLSNADLNQLGKSIAGYSATGDWYTGSGAADVYIATKIAGFQAPPDYFTGMSVRFRPSADNTGAATVNVNTLGVKNIKREDGSALNADDMISTRDAWMRYNGTDFLLTNFTSGDIVTPASLSPTLGVGHLVYVDNSTVAIKSGSGGNIEINIDGTKLTQSGDLTFILGDFGVGGSNLDTGSENNSTPYYLYVDNLAGVMDPVISALAPIEIGLANAGYHPTRTDERCVGSFWNDVGEDIVKFHMVNDRQMFIEHDNDHEPATNKNQSSSWRNLPVNIPLSASAVMFSANVWENGAGAGFLGADGAAGSISTGSRNIYITAGALYCMSVSAANQAGSGTACGEIPIVNRAAPAISYGNNVNGDLTEFNILITGYTDMWALKN
jgi:hypothetical protein